MILNVVRNPKNPVFAEDIVQVTMTRDQFAHLRDCVTLAYQSAAEGSRMVTIARMIRRDIDALADDLERIDAGNGTRAANAPGAAAGKSSCETLLGSALARVVGYAHSLKGDKTWTHAIRGVDYDFARLVLSEAGIQENAQ